MRSVFLLLISTSTKMSTTKRVGMETSKSEPYRARRNTRHQLNSRNRESKEIVKRQHSSNESTHHPSNKSWRSRYSRAPRFRSSSSEHSTSRYQPRTPLSSESRPEKLSVRSSCYSSSTNHPNPSDHCGYKPCEPTWTTI